MDQYDTESVEYVQGNGVPGFGAAVVRKSGDKILSRAFGFCGVDEGYNFETDQEAMKTVAIQRALMMVRSITQAKRDHRKKKSSVIVSGNLLRTSAHGAF